MGATDSMTSAEAVPLVAALAARVAEVSGVRLLLVKDRPVADPDARAAASVGVWVTPGRQADYIGALLELGWSQASSTPAGVGWGRAVTVCHPTWPTTIEVHRFFPGFLEDQRIVFELVWDHHAERTVAGHAVACPDRIRAMVLAALHEAKALDRAAEPDARAVLLPRTADALTPSEREALLAFLRSSGAAAEVVDSIPLAAAAPPRTDSPDAETSGWRRKSPGGRARRGLFAVSSGLRRAVGHSAVVPRPRTGT